MERFDVAGIALDVQIQGQGPALVFLHQEHHRQLNRPFLERMAEHFRVIAPIHPGFDAREPPRDYRTVADIAYTYLELLRQLGVERPLVVGSSFGGWVALEMAVREPAALGALVLLAPLGVKLSGRDAREFTDLWALPDDEAARCLFADRAPDIANFDDEAMTALARDRQYAAYYGWKPYMHTPGLRRWLCRVRGPVGLVWGSEDRFVTPDYGRRLSEAMALAELTSLPGAAHYPQVDQPGSVVEVVRRFARAAGSASR